RYHCLARKPKCEICPLLNDCREGQKRHKAKIKEA
ncbi:MAG: endonuclease III, partial [Staphylococcus epidermidis]|nr:endonuclease III [Staphylococcus epidermidis]